MSINSKMLSYGKSPLVCGKQKRAIHLKAYGKMSEELNLCPLVNFSCKTGLQPILGWGRRYYM